MHTIILLCGMVVKRIDGQPRRRETEYILKICLDTRVYALCKISHKINLKTQISQKTIKTNSAYSPFQAYTVHTPIDEVVAAALRPATKRNQGRSYFRFTQSYQSQISMFNHLATSSQDTLNHNY